MPTALMTVERPVTSLLGCLDDHDRSALAALGAPRAYAPGATVFREGDQRHDVFLLLSGCVKVFAETGDGRAMLLAIRAAGELVGELSALDDGPRSATVIAARPVAALVIAPAAFRGFLRDHRTAEIAIRASLVAKLRQATRFRADMGGARVPVRLARVLQRLATDHGRTGTGGILIDVPLSQAEIAALVGAAEPSVRRSLAELRRTNVVTTGYRRLVVADMARLGSLALAGAR